MKKCWKGIVFFFLINNANVFLLFSFFIFLMCVYSLLGLNLRHSSSCGANMKRIYLSYFPCGCPVEENSVEEEEEEEEDDGRKRKKSKHTKDTVSAPPPPTSPSTTTLPPALITRKLSKKTSQTESTLSKKDPNAPKRPLNTYMTFSIRNRVAIRAAHPNASFVERG